jgi:glycosyltransferase involved in cell wall biosynthesis
MRNKICFVTPQFKTGGGNRVFIEIGNELIKRELDVEIIYPNNSKEKNTFNINSNIKLKQIGSFSNNNLNKLYNVFKTLRWVNKNRKNSTLIITDPLMSLFAFLINKNIDLYRFIQADDYKIFDDLMILNNKLLLSIFKFMTKMSYKSNSIEFIFNSRYVYKRFIEVSNRNDVDFNLVHPSINKNVFYNRNIRNPEKLNIGIVARKHPLKGFQDFIDCWEDLSLQYKTMIDNVFIISHDDLSDFNLNFDKFTRIKPKNDKEISLFYNKSNIFISTSWWEGFGLPPLEAMSCGCSVLTSKSGGVNEYIEDEENCLTYEPKNKKELKDKLIKIIENADLRRKLSKKAKKTTENFSWEKSTDQFLKIINT